MKHNRYILLLGSNIEPGDNLRKALELLNRQVKVNNQSRIWVTEAVGSLGPDFLNIAVEIQSTLNPNQFKQTIIKSIEDVLGRVRSDDKYAPRTIDIDIILFNKKILDINLWSKLFIALPVSELVPHLKNQTEGTILLDIAEKLKSSSKAEPYNIKTTDN